MNDDKSTRYMVVPRKLQEKGTKVLSLESLRRAVTNRWKGVGAVAEIQRQRKRTR